MKQNGRCGAARRVVTPLSAGGVVCLCCALSACSGNEYPGHASNGQGGKATTGTMLALSGAPNQVGGGSGGASAELTASGGASSLVSGGSTEVGGQNGFAGNAGSSANDTCGAGLSSCAGEPPCTSNLATGTVAGGTSKDCGSCGITCSLVNATGAACAAGKCVPACDTGYSDCNAGAFNDGCEANLSTSVTACGGCGRVCSTAGALAVSCESGICAPSCAPKYGDCNRGVGTGADDGCEAYLDELTRCGTTCANGVACPSNQVCNAGACGAAQGLVVFTVPLTSNGQIQRYADKLPTFPDLSGSEVVVRVHAPGATAGALVVYVQDKNYVTGGWSSFPLASLSSGWTDVRLKAGDAAASFDPKHINQITFEVMADGNGPWATPTVVYIDSVRTTNGVLSDTFDISKGNFVSSGMQVVEGSGLDWVSALPPSP